MKQRTFFWGLAIISGCTLMLEILLTRIFSVMMWYHMSLVAVSMAMFGLTLGALVVHWRSRYFLPALAPAACARHAQGFGISLILGLSYCLNSPFVLQASFGAILHSVIWIALAALPFVFSGICVCTALTRFPGEVGKLYAADLAGAALSCLGIVWLLNHLDAPSAILLVAALTFLAACLFDFHAKDKKKTLIAFLVALSLSGCSWFNSKHAFLRVRFALAQAIEPQNLTHEFWNIFSYVTVSKPIQGRYYWGRGDQASVEGSGQNSFLKITMDQRASTPLVRFDGHWEKFEWLFFDATNLAHQLRSTGKVLVIGSGGGRDILSALLPTRGQRNVVGVDINPKMVDLLRLHEAVFSGNLSQFPHVSLYVDEARSWVARSQEKYQVITIPLVDTAAASAAGAYALTENSLYTREAFALFMNHLESDGILSVSRWWYAGRLGETHRLLVLAATALRDSGVQNPREHLYLVKARDLVTLLISKNPLQASDLETLQQACKKFGFQVLLTPLTYAEENLALAVTEPNWPDNHQHAVFLDLSAPDDDRPFFFHSFKIRNFTSSKYFASAGVGNVDKEAMIFLILLVFLTGFLALAVVVIPFLWEKRKKGFIFDRAYGSSLAYFALIGFGFMLFESAQLQRLNIFLGFPVYALTVVLFSLLLASALGAQIAARALKKWRGDVVQPAILALLLTLGITGMTSPLILQRFLGAQTPARILLAGLLMIPPGICMGMFFPLGIYLCEARKNISLAWCWAVNGMTSTCAAVYGIALSITLGFTITYWLSVLTYIAACWFGTRMRRA